MRAGGVRECYITKKSFRPASVDSVEPKCASTVVFLSSSWHNCYWTACEAIFHRFPPRKHCQTALPAPHSRPNTCPLHRSCAFYSVKAKAQQKWDFFFVLVRQRYQHATWRWLRTRAAMNASSSKEANEKFFLQSGRMTATTSCIVTFRFEVLLGGKVCIWKHLACVWTH